MDRKWKAVLGIMLLIALAFLFPHVFANVGQEEVEPAPQEEAFSGVLRIWELPGFYENGLSFAKTQFAAFEKSHPGIRLQYVKGSYAQWEGARQAGNLPDIVLFPLGAIADPDRLFVRMESAGAIKQSVWESGETGKGVYQMPLFMGGYCLIANADFLPEVPRDWYEALETGHVAGKNGRYLLGCPGMSKDIIAYSPDTAWQQDALFALISLYSPPFPKGIFGMEKFLPTAFLSQSYASAFNAFLDGQYASVVANQAQLMQMKDKLEMGLGFSFAVSCRGGFSDRVAYMGVVDKGDAKRAKAAGEFVQMLIGKDAQKALAEKGLFSVREDVTLYEEDAMAYLESALLSPIVPRSFSWQQKFGEAQAFCLGVLKGEISPMKEDFLRSLGAAD